MKFFDTVIIVFILVVAPVRERGLKCDTADALVDRRRRSREGAWIEILFKVLSVKSTLSLP